MKVYSGGAINVLCNSALQVSDASGSLVTRPLLQSGQRNFKILLESVQLHNTISNASASNVVVDIYWLLARASKTQTGDPVGDFTVGLANENIGSSPAVNAFVPGCNPLQVKRFNVNWILLKKISISLGVGRSHTDVFKFALNRYIDTAYAAEFDQIRGVTVQCLLIGRGQAADNLNTFAVGNVGLTRAKVLGVCRAEYKSTIVSDTPKHYQQGNALIDPGFLFVKEEDGDVINTSVAANYA